MGRHIGLADRKPICLKMGFFDTFPGALDPSPLNPTADVDQVALDLLDRLASYRGGGLLGNDRLDDHAREAVARVRTEFDAELRRHARPLGRSYDRLSSAVDALSCDRCAQAAGRERVCCGDEENDDLLVDRAGDCVRQIKGLYELALDIARQYYSAYVPTARLCPVRLVTQPLSPSDIVENLPAEVHATGAVDIRSDESIVELKLRPQAFDRRTYQSLFYILLHECMCHAFQGSVDVTGERSYLGHEDVFGEGWMDFITHLVFAQVLSQQGPFGAEWASRLPRDPDVEDRGSEMHRYRTEIERPGVSRQLGKGRRAAESMQKAWESLLRERRLPSAKIRRQAELHMIEMSLRINTLPLDRKGRERFVTGTRAIFGTEDELRVRSILTMYINEGVNRFVGTCINGLTS